MRNAEGADDFSGYAAARWTTLVRTAVLLGVPPSAAAALAAEAIALTARALAASDGVDDPDVVLFAELIEAHGRDARPWWRWEPSEDDLQARAALAPVQRVLDRLTPDHRARVVLEAVALLPPDQVDQVVSGPGVRLRVDTLAAVTHAAQVVPVGAIEVTPPPGIRQSAGGRRAVSVAAVAVTLLLVVLAAVSATEAVRRSDGAGADAAAGDVTEQGAPVTDTTDTTGDPISLPLSGTPVAWYAEGVLHLGALDVSLDRVVGLDTFSDGVVATLQDGRVLSVDGAGSVSRIARVTPGAEVATSTRGNLVAYIGRSTREVTVYDSRSQVVLARVPADDRAAVVAIDALATYVNDSDGHFVVEFGDAARRTNGITVLDASGGALAIALRTGEVQVLRDGAPGPPMPGTDVVLSLSGRYALVTGTDDDAGVTLVDLETNADLALSLPEDAIVTDAAFDADRSLVVVARRPNVPQRRSREDPNPTQQRNDLITCTLEGQPTCTSVQLLGTSPTEPILAN